METRWTPRDEGTKSSGRRPREKATALRRNRASTRYRDRTWFDLLRSTEGVVAVALFPLVTALSGVFFFVEIRQLLVDGSAEYFNDSFKYLDLLTFAMQIVVDPCRPFRLDEPSSPGRPPAPPRSSTPSS